MLQIAQDLPGCKVIKQDKHMSSFQAFLTAESELLTSQSPYSSEEGCEALKCSSLVSNRQLVC